jgi:hypothetical protein
MSVQNFVKQLVKDINEGMSLKQYFEDDRNATTMIFAIENFPNQFQPNFCHCCGDYIFCETYVLCETEGAPICKNEEHLEITKNCNKKCREKLKIRNIEYWINIAKTGEYEIAMDCIRHLIDN